MSNTMSNSKHTYNSPVLYYLAYLDLVEYKYTDLNFKKPLILEKEPTVEIDDKDRLKFLIRGSDIAKKLVDNDLDPTMWGTTQSNQKIQREPCTLSYYELVSQNNDLN